MTVQAVSQAPLRVSFAGGGTDVEPFSSTYGGLVVNAAINHFQQAILRLRADDEVHLLARTAYGATFAPPPAWLELAGALAKLLWKTSRGFDLEMISAVEQRSGLGGSGAMCLAVAGAMNEFSNAPRSPHQLAEIAYRIEGDVLGNDCGWQDHFAAAYGGVNCYEASPSVSVQPLDTSPAVLRRLEQGLLLLWLGQRKGDSGEIIRQQSRRVSLGGTALRAMLASKAHVHDMAGAVGQGDLPAVGQLLDELWRQKKQFCGRISNSRIDEAYAILQRHGMMGGKVTGAGGGGHLLVCCQPDRRAELIAKADELGLKTLPFGLAPPGLTVKRVSLGQYTSDSNVTAG